MKVFELAEDGEIIKDKFVMHHLHENPVVKPEDIGLTWEEGGEVKKGAVFNGGAVLHENKIYLLPRCHKNYTRIKFYDEKLGIERYGFENYVSRVYVLESEDGIRFRKSGITIEGKTPDFSYGIEDIRITPYHDIYILTGCGKVKPPFKGTGGDRVAFYKTGNFREIEYCGIISLFDSRNAIPFFHNGKHYIFMRFHPDIYLFPLFDFSPVFSPKEHEETWKKLYREKEKYLLIKAGELPHEREKIGPGTPPIFTEEGILFIYHAVGSIEKEIAEIYGIEPQERCYSVCCALLDPENPWKIKARGVYPVYVPSHPYELEGNEKYPVDVPNVIFPVGCVVKDKKAVLYCGAGDRYVVVLSFDVDKLVKYLLEHGKR